MLEQEIKKAKCPKCGYYCARVLADGMILCCSTDWIAPCRFYGTVEGVEIGLDREKDKTKNWRVRG